VVLEGAMAHLADTEEISVAAVVVQKTIPELTEA
jgi:hypothetical protein